jgi:import receptor subunit TOM70
MSSSDSTGQSLVDRVQSFVSENKRAILIGAAAAAIAAGGVAYYASTSRSSTPKTDSERKKDKKKSIKKRKTGSGLGDSKPVLEEVERPAEVDDAGEFFCCPRLA